MSSLSRATSPRVYTAVVVGLLLPACNLETQWAPELLEVQFRIRWEGEQASTTDSAVWASMLRSLDDDPNLGPSSERGDLTGPWEGPIAVASEDEVEAGASTSSRLWSNVPYRIDLVPAAVACGAIEDARDVVDSGVTVVIAMDQDRIRCRLEA